MKRLLAPLIFGFAAITGTVSAAVAAADPFFFVQLTDPQFGMFTGNADFAQETANLEFAVATVNRLRPAFVIVTGDLVNRPGDEAQVAEYRRIMSKVDRAIPVYDVAGNHDVENVPTITSLQRYAADFGRDYYSFRHGRLFGIVLNSCLIHSPQQTADRLSAQEDWLKSELEKARDENARPIVVFQHHPWFVKSATEPDQYFNIPRERRARHLALFREHGVRYLFCGHYHRTVIAKDDTLEVITSGPVGKPLGEGRSGMTIAIVRDDRIEYQYHDFSRLPNRVELNQSAKDAK